MKENSIKKKIVFIIDSLVSGGGEVVLLCVIGYLNPEKYDIHLVLVEEKEVYLSNVPGSVKIHNLKKKSRFDFFKLIVKLAVLLNRIKPDFVMSFLSYSNLLTVWAKFFAIKKSKTIISEHSHLSSILIYERLSWLKKILFGIFYKFSDLCVVPANGVRNDLIDVFGLSGNRVRVIYNPLDLDVIDKLKEEEIHVMAPGKYIIAAGRLSEQKGFCYLLEAYSLICRDIDEKLVIAGEGELEENLKMQAKEFGIEDKVIFLGFQKNPYKFMRHASLLALSSLWESFGLVIVEAMECGIPVVATDCPCGPREIITHGVDGILVPVADARRLADALLLVLRDKVLSKKLVENARNRAKAFGINAILPQYENLFE